MCSGVAHFCLIHVNKLAVHLLILREKIHDEHVQIAVFEHISEFRVNQPELLAARIPRYLDNKHRRSFTAHYQSRNSMPSPSEQRPDAAAAVAEPELHL